MIDRSDVPLVSEVASRVAEQAGPGEVIDVMASAGRSTVVRVHEGALEAFTSARSAGIGVRVIVDGRVGFAHAGSLADDVVVDTLAAARDNVAFAARDPFVGLAEPDGVEPVVADRYVEAVDLMEPDVKIARVAALEAAVRAADPRITGVRAAMWSDSSGETSFASSAGVLRYEVGSSCGLGVQPLASDGASTQIGYAGDAARHPDDLDDARVVRDAVDRTTRLLGATQPRSARLPIVLDGRLAATLLGIVAAMLSGEAVLKGRSPFADRLGERVASPLLNVVDDPTAIESIGSSTWDGEGLACRPNPLLEEGMLSGFLHNAQTGRRSGGASTGSALRGTRSLPGVGAQVLVVKPGTGSLAELCADVGSGLFVTSFSGLHSGVNAVSGDFSVGADGLMIRDGVFAEPVRELTVASSIQRLLLDLVAVGGDAEWLPGGDFVPSMVIADVAVSGA